MLRFLLFHLFLVILLIAGPVSVPAQESNDLELSIDISSNNTAPLPKIFLPNIDLSGRGFHRDQTWPQTVADGEVIKGWQKNIGFGGLYRMQYNLWEIVQLSQIRDKQEELIGNYENIIKEITDAGGTVILNLFGTPAGLGRVLDKKSPPRDIKGFKELVKGHIRYLSCDKKYNVWYEVWSAPDLDGFFLGRKQDYFNLYRAIAEAIKELEAEKKIQIPVGGPSASWWFQNFDGNTVASPERSLIYELIKYCRRYHLPLDFISWHAYSTDPKVEKRTTTIYNKQVVALIRDWLSYFDFPRDTPLIVDEWNYDSGINIAPERNERSNISASYIPSRIKNMYEAGINNQVYFSLEDFKTNKEKVERNTGVFWFDEESSKYKGSPKAAYNIFRMFNMLGKKIFLPSKKIEDEFVGTIVTTSDDYLAIIIYNYIDPDITINYLSQNIPALKKKAERKMLLNLVKSDDLRKLMQQESDIAKLRLTARVKSILAKAQELNQKAKKFMAQARPLEIDIKNLKNSYTYQRYRIDSSCINNCKFLPIEEKEINGTNSYREILTLTPYSVEMIILKKKPEEPEKASPEIEPENKPLVIEATEGSSN